MDRALSGGSSRNVLVGYGSSVSQSTKWTAFSIQSINLVQARVRACGMAIGRRSGDKVHLQTFFHRVQSSEVRTIFNTSSLCEEVPRC
jgi:hypothetical protein